MPDPGALPPALHDRLETARAILRGVDRALIAFSGGVDSTLLAHLARNELGKARAPAIIADSPSLARDDLREAVAVAQRLDLALEIITTAEAADPRYQANTGARCFFCKQELFERLWDLARRRGIPNVLYGAIGDDERRDRPGQRAAAALGVRAPLQEAGFAKWEVRQVARALGLPNWSRPQNACLASRIPRGLRVSERKLAQIEAAERAVHGEGFRQVRVRHWGQRAVIEVGAPELPQLTAAVRFEITRALRQLGFNEVRFDPLGYRSPGASADWLPSKPAHVKPQTSDMRPET